MKRKEITLSAADLASLSDHEANIAARAVSGVISHILEANYDPEFASLSAGDTDEERFNYVALEWLEFIIRYGRLPTTGVVLDIGCGSGRIAQPLSQYLGPEGRYFGFDVTENRIAHCREIMKHPGFSFDLVDLHHPIYNPEGTVSSEEYVFPYDDNAFDVVFAASIFSHLDLNVSKSYLREISRVLKPDGRAILSFFEIPLDEKRHVGEITPTQGRWCVRLRISE